MAAGGGAEVDGAFEGLFEQRGLGFGEADVGVGRAAFAGSLAFGELDPGAGSSGCGRCRGTRSGAG